MKKVPKGMKRVVPPDTSTVRGRLAAWIENPREDEGLYIDTLEPLVQDMLREQRDMCANAVWKMYHSGKYPIDDDDYVRACLNATGGNDDT